jgi:hypothetical protein
MFRGGFVSAVHERSMRRPGRDSERRRLLWHLLHDRGEAGTFRARELVRPCIPPEMHLVSHLEQVAVA